MTAENRSNRYVWVIMMVLSILLLLWTVPLLLLSGGTAILEQGLDLAGSPLVVRDLDEAALGYMNMAMLKPLWEEIWIGILGIYCALGLRQKKKHAWTLGLFWGIMLITNAVIQGVYELIILDWSNACLQTYLFLLLGVVAVVSLLVTRRGFFRNQPGREI
jgi:hypothetical protein